MPQIKRIRVLSAAKIAAAVYLVGSFLVFIPYSFFKLTDQPPLFRIVFVLLAPVLYSLCMFAAAAAGCFLYNFFAQRLGGIEVELGDEERPIPPEQRLR